MISDLREKVIRVLFVALVAWLLQSCFLLPHSYSQDTCNQSKRHQVVVVLVRGLSDPLIKEKSSLGLGDRLREGKG